MQGYLKVGDLFYTYEETEKYKKFTLGEVTGVNKYKLYQNMYILNTEPKLSLIYESIKSKERTLKVSENKIVKAKMIECSCFDGNVYHPYVDDSIDTIRDEFMNIESEYKIQIPYWFDDYHAKQLYKNADMKALENIDYKYIVKKKEIDRPVFKEFYDINKGHLKGRYVEITNTSFAVINFF